MQHVWIFQLAAAPTEAQKAAISHQLQAFIVDWKAHGSPVPGTSELKYDRFVVVFAEPGHASGCSIDSMTKGVTHILQSNDIEVIGPERIFFRNDDGEIDHIDFKEARAHVLAGKLKENTVIFDSTMGQSNEFARWEMPLSQTWLGRFLPQRA